VRVGPASIVPPPAPSMPAPDPVLAEVLTSPTPLPSGPLAAVPSASDPPESLEPRPELSTLVDEAEAEAEAAARADVREREPPAAAPLPRPADRDDLLLRLRQRAATLTDAQRAAILRSRSG
jgi:hypothetical protein